VHKLLEIGWKMTWFEGSLFKLQAPARHMFVVLNKASGIGGPDGTLSHSINK